MTAEMTVETLLTRGRRLLVAADRDTGVAGRAPGLEAELLLAHVLGAARARLKSHPESPVEEARAELYLDLIGRRVTGEPVAYITGQREFWSLELAVTPAVLIPRPETELLVERAPAVAPAQPLRVAELGAGSGAVALALARERPIWQIVATDVSAPALAVARANAAALGLSNV